MNPLDDQALDAVALVEADLAADVDAREVLLHSSDDVEHWRGVAIALVALVVGEIEDDNKLLTTSYRADYRESVLADEREGTS
jgi:hypothetical protein